MKEFYYILCGVSTAFIIIKCFKLFSHLFQQIIFRWRYELKTNREAKFHRNKINHEILENSIKFVEKNYLQ